MAVFSYTGIVCVLLFVFYFCVIFGRSIESSGCTLSDDPRYTYTDFDDNYKDPGSFISDGTTLTVACTSLDLYDLYTSYDYDYNNDSTPTITCMNNVLSQIELDCPEVTPNTCMELQHGSVNEKNGYFIVSCDKGYSLDLILPERPQCTCENGQLKSVYGGQAPACIPDKCVIPYEFDERLSVTDTRRVSLSGGFVVEVGDFVYFNCSKTGESNYEPLNRRFKCVNGLWEEAETDRNWKLGYDGEFPACRRAVCEPNCTNGGVCFKDDNCRCKNLTEGKRCEMFICNDTCFENGGKCVGHGRCSCPAERFGLNCEQKGCILPKHAAKYGDQRIFSPGTTLYNLTCDRGYVLSSQNGMTCRDGRTWSQIVTCIKGCTLPNNAANYKDQRTTFSPGETLNNFVCDYGYVLSSEKGMTCRHDGSWSEIVTCIKVCTLPNHAANATDPRTTFNPGETLNDFYCEQGYDLSSQNGMTCRHDGSWSEIVTCIQVCTLPNHAANSKDWKTTFNPGETLNNFYCEQGYVLSSQNGMTCRHDGSWSEIVTCIQVCTLPNHAANSKDWRTTFNPGETLNNFYCDQGYVLSSQNGMTCRHDGSWSEIVTCIQDIIFEPELHKPTCQDGARQCHSDAICVDYANGFCCSCVAPAFGNGKHCITTELPQRLNGKVSGTLNGVSFENLDMHAFVVTKDGRAYTAISRVPNEISLGLMTLNTIGGVVGWLFALQGGSGARNGYMSTGGQFNRTARIRYQQGDEVVIEQKYHRNNALNKIWMETVINGNVPSLASAEKLTIDDYSEEYKRTSPGVIRSSSDRTFYVNNVASRYTWDQVINYKECAFDPTKDEQDSQRLSVTRNFVIYDPNDKVIRFAMSNRIQRRTGTDPCEEGAQNCDENAVCIPQADSYICDCKTGFVGDGRTCIGEIVRQCGNETCDDNARCVFNNKEQYPMCECLSGFRRDEYGRCRPILQKCKLISPFYGGEVIYNDEWVNAFYSCDDAYSLFPSDIDYSNCTKHRKWKPKPPKCLRKAEVEIPDHGNVCKGKTDIILHSESYAVCCDSGYELYNDNYLEKTRVLIRNNNGSLEPKIPECVEARCDPSEQYMANVQYLNGSNITTEFPSRTGVLLSCKDGYDYYRGDQPMITPLKRTCIKGSINKVPKCKEARCLFSGYPSNKDTYQRVYLGDAQLVFDDQYIEPRQKIEVICHKSRQYELYVNSTETHLEEFISECKHGQFDHKKEEFPICVERRCSFIVSSEVCFWMDDNEHCKSDNFSIPSRSGVHMRCRDGYKLSRSEDGSSVEVDEDALIMCNKGVYDESYRCISELCAVPSVKHANLISKDASSYDHGEKITFVCDIGFHFYQNISTEVNTFETTCNLGQWTDTIPSECKQGCTLSDDPRYTYKDFDGIYTVPGSFISDGTTLTVTCTTLDPYEYDMSYDYDYDYDNNSTSTVTCMNNTLSQLDLDCPEASDYHTAVGSNIHSTESSTAKSQFNIDKRDFLEVFDKTLPTALHNVAENQFRKLAVSIHGRGIIQLSNLVSEDTENVRNISNLLSSSFYKVFNSCSRQDLSTKEAIFMSFHEMSLDTLQPLVDLVQLNIDERLPFRQFSAVLLHQILEDLIASRSDLYQKAETKSSTELSNQEQQILFYLSGFFFNTCTSEKAKRNEIRRKRGSSFRTRVDADSTTKSETDKQSRSKDVLPDKKHIQNTRNKGCTLSDDPRYTYTDFNGIYTVPGSFISDGTTLTVTCRTLDPYGYDMSYDYDYDYDYDNNSTSTVTCMNNTLSDFDLDCPEEKCVVPYVFDERLSVTDTRRVSLSGGSVVEVGDFVYFNCSKPGILKYEPLNRRFQCVNGLWEEAERDHNWKLGSNGAFPACRAAVCKPNCLNGGVCFKDDNCRCKHLTEGKRCEKFICNDTCFENGGKCVGPGRCSCPAERFGLNCEQTESCTLPQHAANYEGQIVFSPGTTLYNFACDHGYVLSSQNGMTCRDDGTWSQIVTCIKGCTLINNAGNYKGWRTTFSPGETLYNFVCDHGYVLSSENGMTCRHDGSWSEIVTCIKGCTLPNNVANSKYKRTTFSPGKTLNNFHCDQGYVLSSENGMTCRHDGSWTEIVTCIKGCSLPNNYINNAANSEYQRTTFSPGNTLNNFHCDQGYILSSENGMTCRHDGSWSGIVTCIKGMFCL
ncbi:uncharacterized protein LOC123548965 [Mercenaria mercenaria]|uniref:uncharacterized protein LOC123548965 n=1 Tax=Mercenaria mercenaria TaxID=6596 RepID=UPI00234F8E13|nr:uncharacterized protein LOC123548965 [Mercenaria mercenaria]